MVNKYIFLGRGEENDIVYSNNTVSRRHAKIEQLNDAQFIITNVSSTNGTMVNGELILTPQKVTVDDNIQFGNQILDWNEVLEIFGQTPNTIDDIRDSSFDSKKYLKKTALILFLMLFIFLIFEFWNYNSPKTINEPYTTNDSLIVADSAQSIEFSNQEEQIDKNKNDDQSEKPKQLYRLKKKPIVYSVACLRSKSDLNTIIGFGADVEYGWITFSSDEVGIDEEIEVGKKLKEQVEKEFKYNSNTSVNTRVQGIFTRLIGALKKPRMSYSLYVIESDEINAFTAGGYIFITTGIINFAKSDDEIACVLAHEIYHNELGHINLILRKEKAARNWLGDFADWGLVASQIFGASFNQENEVYCDMYGVDLAIAAGYDGKVAVDFWKRMKSNGNGLNKIFSTHPFSNERMNCVHDHIERNYE